MKLSRRRLALQVLVGVVGLIGLIGLAWTFRQQPWLRRGIWFFVAWQSFWYLVRAWLMAAIWRREVALSWQLKLYAALTVPLPLILAWYAERGQLSVWLAEESGVVLLADPADAALPEASDVH